MKIKIQKLQNYSEYLMSQQKDYFIGCFQASSKKNFQESHKILIPLCVCISELIKEKKAKVKWWAGFGSFVSNLDRGVCQIEIMIS